MSKDTKEGKVDLEPVNDEYEAKYNITLTIIVYYGVNIASEWRGLKWIVRMGKVMLQHVIMLENFTTS